jgi:hypothetical protein
MLGKIMKHKEQKNPLKIWYISNILEHQKQIKNRFQRKSRGD